MNKSLEKELTKITEYLIEAIKRYENVSPSRQTASQFQSLKLERAEALRQFTEFIESAPLFYLLDNFENMQRFFYKDVQLTSMFKTIYIDVLTLSINNFIEDIEDREYKTKLYDILFKLGIHGIVGSPYESDVQTSLEIIYDGSTQDDNSDRFHLVIPGENTIAMLRGKELEDMYELYNSQGIESVEEEVLAKMKKSPNTRGGNYNKYCDKITNRKTTKKTGCISKSNTKTTRLRKSRKHSKYIKKNNIPTYISKQVKYTKKYHNKPSIYYKHKI